MLNKILYVISSVLLSTVFVSCEDELRIDEIIPEGEGSVSFEVKYNPLRAVKVNTGESRTAGNAIGSIEKDKLTVYMYDAEENLVDIFPSSKFSDYEINQSGNSDMPSDGGKQAESATAKATFTVAGIPFGKYYFYVIANMEALSKDKVPTVNDLKSMTVTWDVGDIAANNQMFGYFTYSGDDESSKGFNAQLCTIAKKTTELHAWMKRAASKVTVCFDGSGLNENVWIYVKSVTIKDIPTTCTIGKENRVPIEPIDAGTTAPGKEPDNWNTVFAKGETLFYDKDGVIKTGTTAADDYHNWLTVAKGSGIQGAVSKDGKEHQEDAEALYFYENCQGDFKDNPNKAWYDKQVKDIKETGENSWKWGQKDFKDNVPGGTYIEVEGYYVSTNPNQVSNGPIIYRFMLGQDVEYNYNAARNDHYKVTLGFKGYANQPDWHINYTEKDPEIYTGQTYYLSYAYNQKGIFPIRIVGDVTEFEVEIVENNWAPYDATNAKASWDSVPPQTVGEGAMAFKWNRSVYDNTSSKEALEGADSKTGFYYGLHRTTFNDADIAKGAPRYRTPIWAGFLALQVPENLEAVIFANDDGYNYDQNVVYLKNYFYGNGGDGKYINKTDQHIRKFSSTDLSFSEGETEKIVGTGNNACKITKAKDGSITVHLPMWTRQKNLFSISGFTGNNPYDTYQRKATVKLTAKYNSNTVTQFKPVYQVRRVVNPKGVWRRWNDNKSFNVKLTRRLTADAESFTEFNSDGEWRAHISIGSTDFISLSGGDRTEGNYIYGKTDTPINFEINFSGVGKTETKCAVIQIEYHGFTCSHQIFVRQGYFTPIQIEGTAKWSSFSLYSCDSKTPYQTEWNEENPNYIDAVVTASPLALGTLFKRGNYAEGILISNNAKPGLGVLQAPGSTKFDLTNGSTKSWSEISGTPFTYINNEGTQVKYGTNTIQHKFRWGRFRATVNGETRYYRVPTHEEYLELLKGDYGVGVLYADDATKPATDVDIAYGFEDFNNNGDNNSSSFGNQAGMRGIIVYNPKNGNQVFFPVGARGIGRRTRQNAVGDNDGVLRYGAVYWVLSTENGAANQYRPIPYNLPASPGAMYWTNQQYGGSYLSWDMNYFDLNFNAYDYASSFYPTGDALPIKLVVDEDGPKNDTSRKR